MPNHFHLYIFSRSAKGKALGEEKSAVSIFLGKLCTSYAMYFNKKYKRTGSLFEGKFRSVHIEDEIQAKYLFSYIHLNPVKLIQSDWKENGIFDSMSAVKFLDSYKWSSYLDFLKLKRKENVILNLEDFPDYFSTKEKFKKEIFEWIKNEEE